MRDATEGKVKPLSLHSDLAHGLLQRVHGETRAFVPYLVAEDRGVVRAWAGWRAALRLARLLGPRNAARLWLLVRRAAATSRLRRTSIRLAVAALCALIVTLGWSTRASAIIRHYPCCPPYWSPQAFGIAVGTQASQGAKILNILTHPGGANTDLVLYDVPGISRLDQSPRITSNGSVISRASIGPDISFSLVGLVPLGHLPHGPSVTSWNLQLSGAPLSPELYFVSEAIVTPAGVPIGLPGPLPWGLEIDPGGGASAAQLIGPVRTLSLGPNEQVEITGNYFPGVGANSNGQGIAWWVVLLIGVGALVTGLVIATGVVNRRRGTTARS